jgi:hypothetical protein
MVQSTASALLSLATTEELFARRLTETQTATDLPSIAQVPPRHDLRPILEEWRDVERRLAAAEPGSSAAVDLVRRFEELRTEYARASEDKRERENRQS